jgi:hypothetical protein
VVWFSNVSSGRTVAGQSLTQPGQCHPGACSRKVAGDIDGCVGGTADLVSFQKQLERSIRGSLAGDVIGQESE